MYMYIFTLNICFFVFDINLYKDMMDREVYGMKPGNNIGFREEYGGWVRIWM